MAEALYRFSELIGLTQTRIEGLVGVSAGTQSKIFASLVIILLARVLSAVTSAILHRYVHDPGRHYRYKKAVGYAFTIVGVVLVARVWFGGLGGVSTYFGLLSAGLAIALQDLVASLAGWGFIHWRKPFSVGDRIQVGEVRGDVIDIRPFQFSLLEVGNWVDGDQSTGRVIHIPNSWTFKQTVANYTSGFEFIWHEISVVVTFESDWEKAKRLLAEISERHGTTLTDTAAGQVRRAARRYMIHYEKLTPIVWTSVVDIGVNLTLRFICRPRERRSIEEAVWEDVLRAFGAEENIDFAYPTQRFYNNRLEGKSGAGGPGSAGSARSEDPG